MERITTAPLNRSDRRAQLELLRGDCELASSCDEAHFIRAAVSLLEGRETRLLDAMLALGACESAVFSLVGERTPWMLSRGDNGACLATTLGRETAEEFTSQGATPALALLAAYLKLLCGGEHSRACGGASGFAGPVRLN